MWWRDFLFFLFPLVGEKKRYNKGSEKWRRKERRDLINELQHLRRGALTAGGGDSGVLLSTPWMQIAFFPIFTPHSVPGLQGQGRAQPKPFN